MLWSELQYNRYACLEFSFLELYNSLVLSIKVNSYNTIVLSVISQSLSSLVLSDNSCNSALSFSSVTILVY